MTVPLSRVEKHPAPLNTTVSTKRSHGAKHQKVYKMALAPNTVRKTHGAVEYDHVDKEL